MTTTTKLDVVDDPKSVFLATIDDLTESELDELPLGAIQLDAAGVILKYNSYESNMASVPKDVAVGRNFFTEIAPCTNVREFYGRFKRGVLAKNLYAKFRYHFSFKKDPRDVVITLFYTI